MNIFKVALDTRHQNGVIGTVTQFDNAVLELQILSDGVIDEAWGQPQFELIAMKRDANPVREVDQDRFTILSKEEHKVQVELKEQFLTCRGTVKMQLVVKDGSRLSTTLFYLVIGQSLDHDIVASYRDAKVLDDLDALNQQTYDDLAFREQRYEEMEESFTELNSTMNANEVERNKAESVRQQTFDINEAYRTRTFNNQVEEQRTSFSNAQTQREESFNTSQQNMSQEFEISQRERESAFNELQKTNQKTFGTNEQKRQTTFTQSQSANQEEFDQMMEDSQQTFDTSELKRQQLFNANEQARGQNESQRVQNESERVQAESQRADAEVIRQQKMTEFEEKATQLSEDLDNQVARVDEFVTANEEKLLGNHDKTDYMGNAHKSVKDAMDANVDWLLGEVNTAHYEGQHITATDTLEGHAKSAILSGNTLVNIENTLFPKTTGWYDNNGVNSFYRNAEIISMMNPNTEYLLYVEALPTVSQFLSVSGGLFGAKAVNLTNGKAIAKVTTTDVLPSQATNYFKSSVGGNLTQEEKESIKLMIIKYQDGMENWDISYFDGMQSVKMPVLSTIGKNLFDGKFTKYEGVYGYYYLNNGTYTCSITDNDTSVDVSNLSFGVSDTGIIWFFDEGTMYNTKRTITNGKLIFYPNTEEAFNKIKQRYHIQIEEGTVATPYEPYKSNILTTPEDLELRGIGDVKDELNVATGELTERIGEVVLDGSENWNFEGEGDTHIEFSLFGKINDATLNGGTICDKIPEKIGDSEGITVQSFGTYVKISKAIASDVESFKTYLQSNPITVQYELAEPVIKTVDLSEYHVYSYKDVTHYDCSSAEGSLVPTLSIDVPTNLPAVVTRQRATIQELEKENVALKNEIVETAKSSLSGDLELMSSQFELDFRLFEIEMNLDMPMALNTRNVRGVKAMAMTVYQQAKTLILAGKYEREDMEYKLNRYKSAGRITVEEYDELIALMDARELVD